jgi:hypothetical protein
MGQWAGRGRPNNLHSTIRNECSELLCLHLADMNYCLELPAERGMDIETMKQLPDLHFIARNLNSGGDLRGKSRERVSGPIPERAFHLKKSRAASSEGFPAVANA